tara:strand:- start:118133 stop:118543 length:411 start_codon:yes stop_codon:yes gene_type:complete
MIPAVFSGRVPVRSVIPVCTGNLRLIQPIVYLANVGCPAPGTGRGAEFPQQHGHIPGLRLAQHQIQGRRRGVTQPPFKGDHDRIVIVGCVGKVVQVGPRDAVAHQPGRQKGMGGYEQHGLWVLPPNHRSGIFIQAQ